VTLGSQRLQCSANALGAAVAGAGPLSDPPASPPRAPRRLISALMPNLATNHIVRVAPIVRALERTHDVELVGALKRGEQLFPPYAREFAYTVVEWDTEDGIVPALRAMRESIRGDLVYAFQPDLLSYGAALLARRRRHIPVVLDITDWEVWRAYEHERTLRHPLHIARILLRSGWRNPSSLAYRWVFDKLVGRADALTVVATVLRRRYGGTLVRHGPDTARFDPARWDGPALRPKWGIDPGARLVLFAGTPSVWKGVDKLLAALDAARVENLRLLMAGKPFASTHPKILHVGFQPHAVMPELIAMADCVVLPQRRHPMAEAQIPQKVFEAMAMAKPVVASAVGDMAEVLDGCGIVVEPESVPALARGIERVFAEPAAAAAMGRAARERCIREYSFDAIERVMADLLRSLPLPERAPLPEGERRWSAGS
jgi:glycosyltransferase involved in cell wall biosynthesis